MVIARRFRCDAVLCGRQIFVERFASDVLAPSARRTGRLDCIVHHLGLALGGRPADIRRLILGQGLSLVIRGLALGIVLSLAAGHLIESLLFQVKPADAGNFAAVCALLAGVGLLAGLLPARAASRIDPSVALRDA